jgi:hypothetical protein
MRNPSSARRHSGAEPAARRITLFRLTCFHEYSPGLVSNIPMWRNLYFVVRYQPADEAITSNVWIPAVVRGAPLPQATLPVMPASCDGGFRESPLACIARSLRVVRVRTKQDP